MISPSLSWIFLGIGLFAIGSGMWGAFRWRKPLDTFAALWTLLGLIGSLVAVLLLQVPGFFRSP